MLSILSNADYNNLQIVSDSVRQNNDDIGVFGQAASHFQSRENVRTCRAAAQNSFLLDQSTSCFERFLKCDMKNAMLMEVRIKE